MTFADILPRLVNLQNAEREAGTSLRSPEAIRNAGYRLVKARDDDRYYLAQDRDLQPLLVRLGDIAEVRFGIKTGANEFFYLEPVERHVADILAGKTGATVRVKNGAGWQGEIETRWLRPVIKSPRELKTLRVRPEDLRFLVFMPPDDLRDKLPLLAAAGELQKRYPQAWTYIQWGEKQGYQKNPTCAARKVWWYLGTPITDVVAIPSRHQQRYFVTHNPDAACLNKNFYGVEASTEICALMMSHIAHLSAELIGRTPGGGGGPLDLDVVMAQQIIILNPAALTAAQRERLLEAFDKLAEREVKSIFEELGLPKPNRDYSNIRVEDVSLERVLPDRRALDAVVFEVLGLTEAEQLAVYRAVVELVKSRLVKARSAG